MANDGEPGWTIVVVRTRAIVLGENPPDHIFINLDTEGIGDLLSDSWATETRIAPFHLDDGVNQFLGGTFGTRFFSSVGREQAMILALDQCGVKAEQGRGLEEDSSQVGS